MAAKKGKVSSSKFGSTASEHKGMRSKGESGNLVNEFKKLQEKFSETTYELKNLAASNEKLTGELLENMNGLVSRLDKIFTIFEEASKHVGDVETAEAKISNLSTKLEALLDQNKTIAHGLIMLEKYVRGKTRLEPSIEPKPLE